MESFIPLVLISILIFVQIKKYKDMCKYLSNTYPEEWEKLSRNSLGTSPLSVANANLSESLKTGFFSTINDEKVKRFEKFRLINMYVMGVIVFIQLVLAYSQ
ncbi:hypothetical protein [uncultured Pseudoalteromonas sp.]|uniref:hypothetical protein n=1 Tax=uncultured Pseudoalteromonas sp. TaxID=114053 RepID=UPI0030C8919D